MIEIISKEINDKRADDIRQWMNGPLGQLVRETIEGKLDEARLRLPGPIKSAPEDYLDLTDQDTLRQFGQAAGDIAQLEIFLKHWDKISSGYFPITETTVTKSS